MIIVRFAGDCVLGFQHEVEAKRFLEDMRLRLAEFSLSLHPEKTKLIQFGPVAFMKWQDYIQVTPGVRSGKARLVGTRITPTEHGQPS